MCKSSFWPEWSEEEVQSGSAMCPYCNSIIEVESEHFQDENASFQDIENGIEQEMPSKDAI